MRHMSNACACRLRVRQVLGAAAISLASRGTVRESVNHTVFMADDPVEEQPDIELPPLDLPPQPEVEVSIYSA